MTTALAAPTARAIPKSILDLRERAKADLARLAAEAAEAEAEDAEANRAALLAALRQEVPADLHALADLHDDWGAGTVGPHLERFDLRISLPGHHEVGLRVVRRAGGPGAPWDRAAFERHNADPLAPPGARPTWTVLLPSGPVRVGSLGVALALAEVGSSGPALVEADEGVPL